MIAPVVENLCPAFFTAHLTEHWICWDKWLDDLKALQQSQQIEQSSKGNCRDRREATHLTNLAAWISPTPQISLRGSSPAEDSLSLSFSFSASVFTKTFTFNGVLVMVDWQSLLGLENTESISWDFSWTFRASACFFFIIIWQEVSKKKKALYSFTNSCFHSKLHT